jgi:hypothetical protein
MIAPANSRGHVERRTDLKCTWSGRIQNSGQREGASERQRGRGTDRVARGRYQAVEALTSWTTFVDNVAEPEQLALGAIRS